MTALDASRTTNAPTTTPTVSPTTSPATGHRTAALAPWLAGLWAIVCTGTAVLHLVRDTGAPWVPTPASVLGSSSSADVSALIVALGTLAAAGLVLRPRSARVAGALLVTSGLVVALLLADVRALTFLGYGPMLLLGLVGIGPASEVDGAVLVPALAAVGHSVGGLALVLTGATAIRASSARGSGWSPRSAARVCRAAVVVAVAVPAFYALTRLAWALGITFGVRDEFLVELGDGKYAGLGLALAALAGCVLTIGLVRRWGEVFWSWLPVLGGRAVPVAMAVVPSVFVGSVVFSAGLAFWRLVLVGEIDETPGAVADWAAWAPELFWPLWGVALVVAGLAYAARRAGDR